MDVALFDYELPEERIALRPVVPRDSARMLVVHEDGSLTNTRVRDLPEFLRNGDMLVVNDSRVIPARLHGRKLASDAEGPAIELLLHKRTTPDRFLALARPARKLAAGDRLQFDGFGAQVFAKRDAGEVEIAFDIAGSALDAAIARTGEIPLPPYIARRRAVDARDVSDYQTMFATNEGSWAATTAGLHFTPDLLARLAEAGVAREQVTLHVGPGTFLPVNTEDTSRHSMHKEWLQVSGQTAANINAAHAAGGHIVAVGTTSLRTLETAAGGNGEVRAWDGETDLFITPGYRFKAVDVLLTNFHLPQIGRA